MDNNQNKENSTSESRNNNNPKTDQTRETTETSPQKKAGRKKTKEPCKNVNVAIPLTLMNKWDEIKSVHESNLTKYIEKLIKQDMDKNYEAYKTISDQIKKLFPS